MAERAGDSRAVHDRSDSRRRVLQLIRASAEGCSAQQIARHTGLHPNTVRFHLERLESEHLVSRRPQRGPGRGRPVLAYTATPVPDAEGGRRNFAALAEVLAQLVGRTSADPAAVAIEAGRSWKLTRAEEAIGSTDPAAAITELVRVLDEAGFDSEISAHHDDEHTVVLHRHCPFLEIARAHQEVVCSLHLGLLNGTLERLNTSAVVERLVPFAGPDGCEAYLTPDKSGSDSR